MTTPKPGDLLINTSGKIIIESDLSTERLVITDHVEATSLEFSEVTLNGYDLSSRVLNVVNTPGVGESNVQEAHIAPSSVFMDKLGLVSTGKGGTGRSSFGDDEVLFSDDSSEVRSSNKFRVTPYGLSVTGSVRLLSPDGTSVTEYRQSGTSLVMEHNGDAKDLSAASFGSAPTIVSLDVAKNGPDATVSYTLKDIDGDLRSLHLAWYSSPPAGVAAPDVLLWTLEGGTGASGSTPVGSVEIELVDSFNTGSSTFSSAHTISGLGGETVYVAGVAEDGPGNTSGIEFATSE